ncbi:hypothetical protein BGP77_05670 [Saccharospirillum sp. MSK14-1]|uniref:hypothetical protein n=1 Tax=Saccharospirillum sp. MSK14-1 TaxID=1897632 RepID=UPI000D3DC271|nr:hypothetical protein [Saccharospirillum sp. MSK14-1]PTY36774.1 hypothetical protein BGP77_05670 [Saccharospirillum sp. MSK14-1]
MKLFFDDRVHTLHPAFERHLTNIDTLREWDVRGLTGHNIDREGEVQLHNEACEKFNDLVADKEKLSPILEQLYRYYNELKQGKTVQQVCGKPERDVHLVIGFMRTGGTFLFKKLMDAIDLDFREFSHLMLHDSLPSYGFCLADHAEETRPFLLLELAEYTYWLNEVWPDNRPVVQKRIAYGHSPKYVEPYHGKNVYWWVTLRDPTDCIKSFLKMENIDPLGQQGYPPLWRMTAERFHGSDMSDWDKHTNYDKALDMWAAYHQDLMSSLDQLTHVTLCPFETFDELDPASLPLPIDLEGFKATPSKRPDYFDAQLHNRAIERVLSVTPDHYKPLIERYRD